VPAKAAGPQETCRSVEGSLTREGGTSICLYLEQRERRENPCLIGEDNVCEKTRWRFIPDPLVSESLLKEWRKGGTVIPLREVV
jgi:hypothetical protein